MYRKTGNKIGEIYLKSNQIAKCAKYNIYNIKYFMYEI